MQTLSQIVPEYAEQVDFYLVSYNENAATLEDYISGRQYADMTPAQPVGSMLRDLRIVSQSSMLALDANGVIAFRKGFGGGSADKLRSEFQALTQ